MRTERNDLRVTPNTLAELRNRVLSVVFMIAAGALAPAVWPVGAVAAEAAAGSQDVEVTPELIREIQFMLARLAIDPGPIDGIVGPRTTKAFHKFEERLGLPIAELVTGGSISASLLARLREDASKAIFGTDKKPEPSAAAAPAPPVQPPAQPVDRFADCTYRAEDFRIGNTQYTPDKYLREGFDGSTARAVSMLKDRLNEARQIAGNLGGSALTEVQRQARVLDYFDCRLKIEQASQK
jgi:peptidoglycan hydrolase-like protein with peptidoglycan-binding domain